MEFNELLTEELNASITSDENKVKLKQVAQNNGVAVTSTDTPGTLLDKLNNEAGNVLKKGDVIDNLTSTDINKPLSANQGKILNEKINNAGGGSGGGLNKASKSIYFYTLTDKAETNIFDGITFTNSQALREITDTEERGIIDKLFKEANFIFAKADGGFEVKCWVYNDKLLIKTTYLVKQDYPGEMFYTIVYPDYTYKSIAKGKENSANFIRFYWV